MITADQLIDVIDEVEPTIRARFGQRTGKISRRFDIDDLLQATRLKAFAAFERCQADADAPSLRHWVLQIARNTYLTEVEKHVGTGSRSMKREAGHPEFETWSDAESVDPVVLSEECSEIASHLDAIPSRQAAAVRMSYLDGLPYTEIADRMGLEVNAVRLLVSRGLRAIRGLAAPYGYSLDRDGRLVEIPAEQNTIAAMRKLHSRGWTYSEIAEVATTRRLLARKGTAWTTAKVREILTAD